MATPTPAQLAIATLYIAAFNRAPEAGGFDFWLSALGRGASLQSLATTFISAPESRASYPPGLSSQDFVAAFYTSVFGRGADAEGLKFWSDALEARGGASSDAARAGLMIDIIGIASSPLGAKPEGLSDSAYAQTVADRARFANKAEFGVYFAADLRSNDTSLAKQMLALVTADPASVAVARTFAEQGGIPVTPPVAPPVVIPALTSADDVAAITSKLAAYGGAAATADTRGMDAAQLKAIAAGLGKIKADGLSGALVLSSTVTGSEAGALLAKYGGTTASANAVGMDSAYFVVLAGAASKFAAASVATPTLTLADALLDDATTDSLLTMSTGAQIAAAGATAAELLSIVNHSGSVASAGITGTFALLGSLDATQLGTLFGKMHADARVTADVSAMPASQLAVLAANPLALNPGALTGTLNLSAPLTGTAVNVLLNRYAGTDATLTATGVGSDVLNAAAATLGKVVSISGDLTILSDVIPSYGLILLGKYVGSSATIDASTFNATQLEVLNAQLAKLTTVTQPNLALANAWLTPTALAQFLIKSTDATVDVTGSGAAQITTVLGQLPKIAADGIVGTLGIISTTALAANLEALLQKSAVAATVNVNAASMTADQIAVLFTQAAKIDSLSNLSVPGSVWASLPNDFGTLFTKGNGIQADLSGASAAQLKLVTQFPFQYASGGLTGSFALDQGFSASQLGRLLGDRVNDTANVSVNAATMDLNQVVALFQNAGNVDQLSNLSAPTGTMAQLGNNFGLLFTKGIGHAVDLTGATAQQLGVIAQFVNQYKADGLTGSFTITKDVSWSSYAALLSDRVADAANVTINATGMSNDQLTAVVSGIGKVDTITGLSLSAANLPALSVSNLGSLLSKATDANLDVTGLDSAKLGAVFNNLTHVANDGISGTLTITNSLAAATLGTFFQKVATGATLSVDAASMDVDQVLALFANAGKIDSLSNLSVPSGTMARLPDDLGTLFQKGIGIKVDLTGANIAQVNDAARYLNQYASEGLTGTYTIDKSIPLNLLSGLLGATATAANVTVQGDGMSGAQVYSVTSAQSKVDAFKQLALSSGDVGPFYMTSSVFSQILAKSTDLKLEVDALDSAKLNSLVSSLSHIADAGLTGTLKLSSAQFSVAGGASLDAKLASAATVQVTGTVNDDVVSLTGLSKQAYVDTGAGADVVTLGSGKGTVLIGGKADSRSTAVVDTTQSTSASIDRIAGLKDGDVIKLSTEANVYGAGITFTAGTLVGHVQGWENTASNTPATFADLYGSLTGYVHRESTSAAPSLLMVQLTSESGLTGRFLIISDSNPLITPDDTIIELIGATGELVYTI